MTDLGQFLKQTREDKNLSLEEMQTATKIQKRYLAAIEDGRYDVLPGAFYARAFIKNYCEAVGLNYEAVFEEYENEIPKAVKEPTEFVPRSERSRQPVEHEDAVWKKYMPAAVIGIVILVLLVGIWVIAQKSGHSSSGMPAAAQKPSSAETSQASQKNDKKKESASKQKGSEKTASSSNATPSNPFVLNKKETVGIETTYTWAGTDPLTVELTFNGASSVDVHGDGQTMDIHIYKKGESKTYTFANQKEVLFNLGATHVTSMKVNGQPFEYPIAPTHAVHQRILFIKAKTSAQ